MRAKRSRRERILGLIERIQDARHQLGVEFDLTSRNPETRELIKREGILIQRWFRLSKALGRKGLLRGPVR